jgi:hypothetical protein
VIILKFHLSCYHIIQILLQKALKIRTLDNAQLLIHNLGRTLLETIDTAQAYERGNRPKPMHSLVFANKTKPEASESDEALGIRPSEKWQLC